MSVELNENSMENLLKDFDVKKINSGDILKGQIIDVNDKEATVNINYAFDGVISKEELVVGDVSPADVVKTGDILDVYVISPNDGEGYVQLSRLRALQITEKEDLKKAFENKIIGKGFSIVEVLSTCPTNWGMSPVEAMQRVRDEMIPYYPLGVFKDIEDVEEDK